MSRQKHDAAEPNRGKALIHIARGAIAQALGEAYPPAPRDRDEGLSEWGATFVTLTQAGELRGCIGSLQAHRPLAEDVHHNALAAAFRDPRFAPLCRHELEMTECEVSLLSAAERMKFSGEHDALSQLRPGVDGVIFEYGPYHSTFLPQVWEQLPHPRHFMAHLKRKAGLHDGFWAEEVQLSRYTVNKWREADFSKAHD